jgi:hypothetical protein
VAPTAVYVFTAYQLATGGSQIPTLTITSNPGFNGPLGITFSASGDLWIANNASTSIYKFNAAALPSPSILATVSLIHDVILSDNGNNSIQGPWALVFDRAGNLWSSNSIDPNTVVEFEERLLGTTGEPVPAVTLIPTKEKGGAATLGWPTGIAFDNLGDLVALSSISPFGAALFSPGQLAAPGGKVLPRTLLVGKITTLKVPAGCTFGPFIKK